MSYRQTPAGHSQEPGAKIRDVRQLIVPPGRSEVLVRSLVQVLQGRGDDPRSTNGAGVNLELSGFEVLSDGRRNR